MIGRLWRWTDGARKTVALVYFTNAFFYLFKKNIEPFLWPDGNPAEQGKSGEIPAQARYCNVCCGVDDPLPKARRKCHGKARARRPTKNHGQDQGRGLRAIQIRQDMSMLLEDLLWEKTDGETILRETNGFRRK